MKGTLPQWIGAGALIIIAATIGLGWHELSDVWVTAVATVLAVLVSIVAIIIPLFQEKARKRREHLKVLVDEILGPLSDKLQQKYLATTSRKTFPLEWIHGRGLVVKTRSSMMAVLLPTPEPPRGLHKHRYEDVKQNHYPDVIRHLEGFERSFEELLDSMLVQAQELEKELRQLGVLKALDDSREALGCYYGALALYVFDRFWVKGYDFPLAVRRSTTAQSEVWLLQKTSDTTDCARGTEQEMRQLLERVEALIASKDRTAFTKAADEMNQKLMDLQDEIAEVQASEKLEGRCPAMN